LTRAEGAQKGIVMNKRRSILTGLLSFASSSLVKKATADGGGGKLQLFFAYRNVVINFDLNTGVGNDLGTVEGVLSGAIVQNFQFIPVSPPTVPPTTQTPNNRALFTDLDGDQILFKYAGNGTFIFPLSDPGAPLGNLMSVGGPIRVTYTVLSASGKYTFLIGRQFPAKLVASNAVNISNGVFGSVYGEIYADDVHSIEKALNRQGG